MLLFIKANFCRCVCFLNGLIFLSLSEKQPRIAKCDNLPETGAANARSRHFPAPISKPYIIYYSPAHIDMYYLLSLCKYKMTDTKEQRTTKELKMQFPPHHSLTPHTYFLQVLLFFFFIVLYHLFDCFWSQIYCLWCLHAVQLSPAPSVYILDIIPGCPCSILGHNGASFIFCVIMR